MKSPSKVQLNPFNPPVYPLLNVLNKMAVESYILFNGNDLAELNMNLSEFIGVKEFYLSDIQVSKGGYLSGIDEIVSQILNYPDGLMTSDSNDMVELTGYPPYSVDFSKFGIENVVYRFNPFVGLDREIVLILNNDRSAKNYLDIGQLTVDQLKALKLVSLLLSDFVLQKQLIKRDMNYKSVLIVNLIEKNPMLEFFHQPHTSHPSSVYSFIVPNMDHNDFYRQMINNGIEIGRMKNNEGDDYFTIANFITHSKEQIELFIDSANKILVN